MFRSIVLILKDSGIAKFKLENNQGVKPIIPPLPHAYKDQTFHGFATKSLVYITWCSSLAYFFNKYPNIKGLNQGEKK